MADGSAPMDKGWLEGRTVWVIDLGHSVLSPIADGLADHGAAVARLTGGAFASQADADAAVATLGDAPDLVIISVLPPEAMRIAPLTDFTPAEWRDATGQGLRTATYLLRALSAQVQSPGSAIVFVGPSLSLVGAPELVALSTLVEGLRGLVKSVARQWGHTGARLNFVAAAPRALDGFFADANLATKPDAVTVALGRPLDPRSEIVPVLGFLGSPAGRGLTGATLTLDGGEWMLP